MKRTNISFYVLILITVTVSGIITALLYKTFPLFTSNTLIFCKQLLSSIMFEIPRSLPTTLLLAVGTVLMLGLLSFILQLVKTHIFLRKLLVGEVNMPTSLARTLGNLNLNNKVILVKNKNLLSFCYGIFFPLIVISTGLIQSLTNKELEAVLLHEQSHLLSKDPIKVLIGKTFSSMFFFLPILRELHKNTEAVNELLADQWTINHQQKATFLRRALKKMLATPQLSLAAVSGASHPDYFEIRVHRIINPEVKHKFRASLVSLVTFFFFIFSSWFLLQTPVSAFHTHEESNSAYLLCSEDPSCLKQCHQNNEIEMSYDDNPKDLNYSSPRF